MLGTRLTEPRRVVSLFDDALVGVDPVALATYSVTRRLEDLGDLAALPSAPTIFVMAPMTTVTERFRDSDRATFAFNCKAIENAPPTWPLVWDDGTAGTRHVTDALADSVPDNVVSEMARVAREMANGDAAPFSPPGGWQAWQSRAQLARAAATARTAAANAKADGG